MNPMPAAEPGTPNASWDSTDAWLFAAVLVVAVGIRALFYTGYLGSDEVTYTESALGVLSGEWPVSDYIGSLRYGINIPVAVFMKLFGVNELAANLWSFVTSIGEVALVFVTGKMLWGRRAGVLASLVLAVLPLHVHFAGRLMADAPLAFFMTLSCTLFLKAEASKRAIWYFGAGLAAGTVFWVKQAVLVYIAIFGLYVLLRRRWEVRNILWMILGFGSVIAVNLYLMQWITGDAFHVFKVSRAGIKRFVEEGVEETSPFFYLRYLLGDIRHTWLLAFLAIGGATLLARDRSRRRSIPDGAAFVLIWAAGLIVIFSIFTVSITPFKLVFKQTNYMLMFVAPLALLAGLGMSRLSNPKLAPALGAVVIGSIILSALEQQAIQVFAANSKAAVLFAESTPGATIYGTTNNVRAEVFANMMARRGAQPGSFKELKDLTELRSLDLATPQTGPATFAIVDLETIDWPDRHGPITGIADVPHCWRQVSQLEPIGLGFGHRVVQAMLAIAEATPSALADRVAPRIRGLAGPKPAYVYRIDLRCNDGLHSPQIPTGAAAGT